MLMVSKRVKTSAASYHWSQPLSFVRAGRIHDVGRQLGGETLGDDTSHPLWNIFEYRDNRNRILS